MYIIIVYALNQNEVYKSEFPSDKYNPYKMSLEESEKFLQLMDKDAVEREDKSKHISKKLRDNDEYEVVKLY